MSRLKSRPSLSFLNPCLASFDTVDSDPHFNEVVQDWSGRKGSPPAS